MDESKGEEAEEARCRFVLCSQCVLKSKLTSQDGWLAVNCNANCFWEARGTRRRFRQSGSRKTMHHYATLCDDQVLMSNLISK